MVEPNSRVFARRGYCLFVNPLQNTCSVAVAMSVKWRREGAMFTE